MRVDIFDLQGKSIGKIELPKVFSENLRQDLIRRAFLSIQSKKIQPYGTAISAGKRTSAHYHGYKRHRWTMMSREMARMPRIHGKVSGHLYFQARFVPQARGGRVAHPPRVEKIWVKKINKKENKKAVRSAIAATSLKELVLNRGHRVGKIESLPIVVDDKIQEIKKTKDLVKFLTSLNLSEELERIQDKKIRAGKGKRRGRKYKAKIGPLIVINEDKGICKAAKNIAGVNVCRVTNLSVEHLAPGSLPGRLTIFSKSSIDKLGEIK